MNRIQNHRPRIGIIGAGIAGLYAAHKLQSQGVNVTVFEAESRIGGRIYTHHSSAGVCEFGAMRIHPSHKLVFRLISHFGIKVRRFVNTNPAAYYLIGNTKFRGFDWSRAGDLFNLAGSDPRATIRTALESLSQEIGESDIADIERGVLPSRLKTLDMTPLWDLIPENMPPETKTLGMLAKSLLQYAGVSGLEMAILARFAGGDVMYEIAGGMDTLTNVLGKTLGRSVLLDHTVRSIRAVQGGVVTVSSSPRGTRFDAFDAILCTVPAPAVSRIAFKPELPLLQRMAFNQVHYTSAAKSVITLKDRVWELSDGIYGGISVTDGIAQNVVYPSDNRAGNVPFLVSTPDVIADSDPALSADLPPGPLQADRSSSPSLFCGLYARENAARRFMSLADAEKDDEVVRVLGALHPRIASRIINVEHWCWDLHSTTGGGAFAHYYPGERDRLQAQMRKAWPAGSARVWFAGEHLSAFHGWIEGALRSVENIISRLTAVAPTQIPEVLTVAGSEHPSGVTAETSV